MKTRRRKQRGGNVFDWVSNKANTVVKAFSPPAAFSQPAATSEGDSEPFKISSYFFGKGNNNSDEDDMVGDVKRSLSDKMSKLDQQIAALQKELDELASTNSNRSQTIEASLAKKMSNKEKLQGILMNVSDNQPVTAEGNNQTMQEDVRTEGNNQTMQEDVRTEAAQTEANNQTMQEAARTEGNNPAELNSKSETLLTGPDGSTPDQVERTIGGWRRRSKRRMRSNKLRRRYGYSRRSSRRRRSRR